MATDQTRERRPKGMGRLQWKGNRVRGRKRVAGRDLYTAWFERPADAEKALTKLGKTGHISPAKMPSLSVYIESLLLAPDEDLPDEEKRPDLDYPWRGRYDVIYEENTWSLHQSRWRLWIAPSKLGRMPIDQIKRRDVKAFVWGFKGKMAPSSLRRLGSVVHTALENAVVEDELIETNPAHKIEYPEIPESVGQLLEDKDIREIYEMATAFDRVHDPRQFARMVLVTLDCGFRSGEVCAIPKTGFDRKGRTITVAVSAKRRSGGIEVKGTKTNKVRVVDLSSDVVAAIAEELKERPNRGSFIFARSDGQAFRPDTFGAQFRKFRAMAGLEGVTLRDLRKTAVTLFVEEGDLKSAQKLAGHSRSEITSNIYQQARRERQTAAVEGVEKRIGRRMESAPEKDAKTS